MDPDLNSVQQAASDQFGRQSHRYGKGHILEDVADVRLALGGIALPARARVLDVATGAGHTGLLLASLGHEVTLSDLTAPMLQRAREAAAARGLAVHFCQHPAETMPYPAASFDLVTCRVAPHHFSAPDRFVAEVGRVLVPGGHFLLIDGTVPDDEPEAEAWLHEVEKLRDPSHHRLLTPRTWTNLCAAAGLDVESARIQLKKQPDLEWYFETAATSPENRRRVRELVAQAPASVQRLLSLGAEDGKTVWWWPMLTLVARR
ncbi:MAG TPA: class I SAM-dependent methyltransferase [Candidatus Limnocylindria bacterium]|nr:class I SAM-dependent methyltransferase [Candidatus Limnocylindria bacterium]